MTERAFQLEGFDGASRLPVRLELRLITNDEVAPQPPTVFSAPRGFLPEEDCTTGPTGRELEEVLHLQALRRTGFAAPRGFLSE